MESSTKVVTGKVRFAYAKVFDAVALNDGEEPKYSICVLIPKSDTKTVKAIKKAIEAAKVAGKSYLADRNGRIPSTIKQPLRDGDDERSDDPAFENMYFLNASSKRRPAIVDASLNPIMERDEFYSGCWGRVSLNFFAYNNQSRGIAAGLNNLQKLEDDEPLGGGSTAEEDFGGANAWDDLM